MSEMLDKMLEAAEEAEENQLTEEEVRFRVDDDQKADWCLRKIREANEEADKMTAWYTEQMKKILKRRDERVAFFEEKLKPYFAMVPKKETKTQLSYQLPGGKLVLKKQGPEFERNDEQLLPWLKENIPALVKVKEAPDWANLKKHLTVIGDKAADPDGEIVPGITVVERPEVFKVEVK